MLKFEVRYCTEMDTTLKIETKTAQMVQLYKENYVHNNSKIAQNKFQQLKKRIF